MAPKKQIFLHLARQGKALANPNRLELLEALGQGERSVEDLAAVTGMSVANTSHHLQVLRNGGLVASRRQGVQVFYRLSDDNVVAVLADLRQLAERHLADIGQILRREFASRDDVAPVRRKELVRMIKAGAVTLIDVRPTEEYRTGHIAGAVNLPLAELSRRLAEIPRDREVVAYCRGPYCLLAFDAVKLLRARGFGARRLADGFPEWKAERGPVAAVPQ